MLKVRLEKFEGPLDLLLKLIEKEELDITQISLAKIADQYIEIIRSTENIEPEQLATFLVIAARLILLKSKAILPYLFPEEEQEIEELERQLKLYKEFLDASKKIQKILGKKKFMFAREFNRKVVLTSTSSFYPPKTLTREHLKTVFEEFLTKIKPPEQLKEESIKDNIKIEDKIAYLQDMMIKRVKYSFNKMIENAESKTEVIVSFLAMLELMRMREVVLVQDNLFDDIEINYKKSDI